MEKILSSSNCNAVNDRVKHVVYDLLSADIISQSKKQAMAIAGDPACVVRTDPALEMTYRHQLAKATAHTARSISRTEIMNAAKRLVCQEELDRKQNVLRLKHFEAELEQFKMDLARSSQSLSRDCFLTPRAVKRPARSRSKPARPRSCTVRCIRDIETLIPESTQNDSEKNTEIPLVFQLDVNHSENYTLQSTEENTPVVDKLTCVDAPIGQTEPATTIQIVIYEKDITLMKRFWYSWIHYVAGIKTQKKIAKENDVAINKIESFVSLLCAKKTKSSPKTKTPQTKYILCPDISTKIQKKKYFRNDNFSPLVSKQTNLEKVIEQQKSKLREQQKIIENLKLEKIKLANERSVQQARIYMENNLKEVSLTTRRKLNYLKTTFPEILDKNFNKPRPSFLVQMETRQMERLKRKREIREQTKQRILEQQRLKEESDREKKAYLAEQEKIEHELKMQFLEEQAKNRELSREAKIFCSIRRLRLGFQVFKRALELRSAREVAAESQYQSSLLRRALRGWRRAAEVAQEERVEQVRRLHQQAVLRRILAAWTLLGLEARRDRQVAEDFNQLQITSQTFRLWRGEALARYEELCTLMQRASLHHRREVLRRSLAAWRVLRETKDQERRAERKRESLRNCVRLVVPDFKPAVPLLHSLPLSLTQQCFYVPQ